MLMSGMSLGFLGFLHCHQCRPSLAQIRRAVLLLGAEDGVRSRFLHLVPPPLRVPVVRFTCRGRLQPLAQSIPVVEVHRSAVVGASDQRQKVVLRAQMRVVGLHNCDQLGPGTRKAPRYGLRLCADTSACFQRRRIRPVARAYAAQRPSAKPSTVRERSTRTWRSWTMGILV